MPIIGDFNENTQFFMRIAAKSIDNKGSRFSKKYFQIFPSIIAGSLTSLVSGLASLALAIVDIENTPHHLYRAARGVSNFVLLLLMGITAMFYPGAVRGAEVVFDKVEEAAVVDSIETREGDILERADKVIEDRYGPEIVNSKWEAGGFEGAKKYVLSELSKDIGRSDITLKIPKEDGSIEDYTIKVADIPGGDSSEARALKKGYAEEVFRRVKVAVNRIYGGDEDKQNRITLNIMMHLFQASLVSVEQDAVLAIFELKKELPAKLGGDFSYTLQVNGDSLEVVGKLLSEYGLASEPERGGRLPISLISTSSYAHRNMEAGVVRTQIERTIKSA